jgi:hypothetical protein
VDQLNSLIGESNQNISTLGSLRLKLDEKMTIDVDRHNSLMPGEVEKLEDIQSAQLTVNQLAEADKQLARFQHLATILSKVVRHGDTQVVVPHWIPSQGGVNLLHKCSADFPKELRDYLLTVVKQRGPIWTQFFWRSLDSYPCPLHLNNKGDCTELVNAWDGAKPCPMPLHLQKIVKEMMTRSTNFQDWDTYHRGIFAWWQCIVTWNVLHSKKQVEKVEFPSVLGGRSVVKQNTLSGDQRTTKKLDAAVARALAPINEALSSLAESVRLAQVGRGTAILQDGSTVNLVNTDGLQQKVTQLEALIEASSGPSVQEVPSEDTSDVKDKSPGGSPGPSNSMALSPAEGDNGDLPSEIGLTEFQGVTWYVATSSLELLHVMEPLATGDSLVEMVMCVKPDHPAFPSGYQGFACLWLVSCKRVCIPSSGSIPLKVIPTSLSKSEEIFDLSLSVGPKEDPKGKKKQEEAPAPKKAPEAAKPTKKKSSGKVVASGADGSEGKAASGKSKGPALTQENPLNVQKAPKSSGLTDEQKVALKKALELPTEPIDQDVLADMSKEERRAALAERSLPRWAVTAVLNNPANLERIVKKELTKESFGKKAADRGTSAQQDWIILRSKFPGVTLLAKPNSNKEKEFKKSWDSLVRKWGRDAPGLPKPKGNRDASSDSKGANRGRSRQRADASSFGASGLLETMKAMGELARAFSGKG